MTGVVIFKIAQSLENKGFFLFSDSKKQVFESLTLPKELLIVIHTVQLRRFLPKELFDAIRSDLRYGFHFQKGKGLLTTQYSDIGINEVKMTRYSQRGKTFYYIDFVINLNLFMSADDDISNENISFYRNTPLQGNSINPVLIYTMYAKLFEIFPLLNMCDITWGNYDGLENMHSWEASIEWEKANHNAFSLCEMDYTYDIPLPYVKTYLKLLNYGHQPGRIKRIRHEHEEGEDNLYEYNGSIKINTYDKERELMERFGDEELAQKNQVLRVEVGLKRRKLSNMVNNAQYSEIKERTLFDFADIDTAYQTVTKYMRQRCYRGNYYDYNTAMNIIDSNEKIKPNMKSKLKDVIEGVKNYHGVDKYIEKAIADGKKEATIKDHIKRLEELEINPVTISKRDKEAFPLPDGGRWLPSIFTIIDKMYAIEKDNMEHPEKAIELMDN